jgi:2-methylcitrate dehydratase PrpD
VVEDLTGKVIAHLRTRRDLMRDPETREAIELHLLDTLAAIISGRVMPAGEAAGRWLETRGATGRSSAAGSDGRHHVEEASFVNAVCAHADESDDSHEPSRSHPGAGIVPVAIAVGEQLGSSGDDVLDAIGLGYENCALMNWLTWKTDQQRRRAHPSTHGLGSLWGAMAAASTLHGFDDGMMRSMVAYTGQLASGLGTWLRDEHHIEKAFAFSGMGAWNAVRAAELVAVGWPGVRDTLDGDINYFSALQLEPAVEALERAASSGPIVVETNIKKYCVGSPAQAAVQAAEELVAAGVTADRIAGVRTVLPEDLAYIVNARDMSNINVQYLVARTLVEGTCTFAAAHDEEGARKPEVAGVLSKTTLVADTELEPKRQARVEVDLTDGSTEARHVFPVRGTSDDPMTRREVEAKADDLLSMALGPDDRARLIEACRGLNAGGLEVIGECLRAARDTGIYSSIANG